MLMKILQKGPGTCFVILPPSRNTEKSLARFMNFYFHRSIKVWHFLSAGVEKI